MPAVAVKISEDFAAAARSEAEQADRSLTGQVEHWGKLGRGVEALLPPPVVALIKRSGGDLEAVMDPQLRQKIMAAFEAFQRLSPEEKQSHLGLDQRVLYEADPANPGGIIQVLPDGRKVRGEIVNRQFVPLAS